MVRFRWLAAIFCFLVSPAFLCVSPSLGAQQLRFPEYAPLVDQAGVLTTAERNRVSGRLKEFTERTGSEVAILIVRTLGGEDIAAFSNDLANHWKPGRPGVGDGVVVVLATDDRLARIEVAKDLEGAIPDAVAKRILAEHMRPHFQRGAYAEGLDAGLTELFGRIEAEKLPPPGTGAEAARASWGGLLFGFVFAELLLIFLFLAGRLVFHVAGKWSRFVAPPFGILVSLMQAVVCLVAGSAVSTNALVSVAAFLLTLVLGSIFLVRHFWKVATGEIVPSWRMLARLSSIADRLPNVEFGWSSSNSGSTGTTSRRSESSSSRGGDFGGGGASDRW